VCRRRGPWGESRVPARLRAARPVDGRPHEEDTITRIDAAEPSATQRVGQGAAAGPPRFAWADLGLILMVTALVRWLSGAQRFTTLHTPDSEFYYSLGVFGSAITDRAPTDYYYWTKLGIILPVRALSELLPPLVALSAFHFLLTALVGGSAYLVARLRWSRLGSCLAAAFAALNTVVLVFVGDPYASGAAIAGLSVLFATATLWTQGRSPFGLWPPVVMGLAGVWLLMINPYALIVGAAGCAGVVLAGLREARAAGAGALVRALAAGAGGFAVGLAAFLALGWWVFPGLNWFRSLAEFVFTADLSAWTDPTWRWLATETSLLVPLAGAIVSLLALVLDPRSRATRTAAGLSCVTIVVAVAYKLLSDSNVLEVSVYSSMLWPSTLLALALVASGTSEPARGLSPLAVAVIAPAWVVAGHWSTTISTPGAVALTSIALICAGGLLAWARGGRVMLSSAWPIAAVGVVLLTVLGSVFQILQNGRPEFPEGTHRRVPYSAAFLPNRAGDVLVQDTAIQSWLISSTGETEQLLVWNEPETRSAASMQLWGSNSVGPGFGEPLGPDEMKRITEVRPDAIVIYALDASTVAGIRETLSAEWAVAPPVCRAFHSTDAAPSMEVCILRLGGAPRRTTPG
jgi:hypothetical protein